MKQQQKARLEMVNPFKHKPRQVTSTKALMLIQSHLHWLFSPPFLFTSLCTFTSFLFLPPLSLQVTGTSTQSDARQDTDTPVALVTFFYSSIPKIPRANASNEIVTTPCYRNNLIMANCNPTIQTLLCACRVPSNQVQNHYLCKRHSKRWSERHKKQGCYTFRQTS